VSSLQQAKAAPPPDNVGSSVERIVRFALNENALILLVLLVVACGLLSPNFLSPQNIANLADQLPIFAILAAGQLVVILTGGIDLSVGSVLALCAFFAAALSHHGLLPAIVVPVLVGGGVGLLNGMGAAFTRVPPFIITLAMLSIARGFALQSAAWYNGGSITGSGAAPVSASRDFGFQFVSSGNVFGLPIAALIAIAVFAGVAYILRYEPFGRHVYAVGGNESAALLLGVNVKRVKMLVYSISGMLAGLAGVLYASRQGSAPPTAAGGYELDAITAVVVGGALLTGGVGTVRGTVIGLLIVRILPNIFNLLGLDPAWQQVARGGVLIAVVLMQIPMAAANARRKTSPSPAGKL
jgi:ribose/xylose/arabinose/galactoside ABC-type transport system permease subunit